MWYLFFIFTFIATFCSSDASYVHQHTAIDSFVQRLKLEKWEKNETPCLEKTLTLLENVKNFTLWATWIWNANSIPTGNLYGSWVNLGNFDQCMKPPWLDTHPQFRTKYCVAQLVLSDNPKKVPDYDPYGSTEEYLNSPTTSGLPVNYLLWGMCVPAVCHPSSIVKITRSMYDITTFGSQAPNITVDNCQVAGDKLQYGVGFYLFIALLVSLVIIAAASTYYRLHIASDDKPPESLGNIIAKSFCIIKNHQDLVKNNKEDIRVMNGMRFLTAASVIIVHETFYLIMAGVVNSRDFDKNIEGLGGMLLHLDVIIDTFFVMSGLLHIKGLLSNANTQQNLFNVLWKRYMRLIGPFALTIFYIISVSKYTGSGPLWIYGNEFESEVCLKTWRLSFLMLNNDPKYICHGVTWYIPCDYQLAILGTVLFYFYQKNRRVGYAAFATAAVLSLIIPGVLTYWYQLQAVHFLDFGRIVQDLRGYWEISYTYMSSYSRAGAYLVGVAMGYLMTFYTPAEYRNTVSKTWSIFGTTTSLAVMLYILSLGQFFINREYNVVEAVVTASTNRIAWAVAICVIIGCCEYGTVPVVTDILSLSFFTPLSRLSYSIYLIHPLIVQRNKFSLRSALKFDKFSIGLDTIGTLTTSIGLSFAMWMLVEAPLINMCNHLLFTKRLLRDIRGYWEISYTYMSSYSRAGAYLVGVAMGYLMTFYRPAEYRRTVSKTWSIVGTTVSLAVMLYIISLGQFLINREYNPLEAAVIASTNRIAWAVAICVIIGCCEYGTVPAVTDILSLSIFTPLSRLSYGIYLIHPLIVQRNKFSLRSPMKFDTFSIVLDTIGTLTTSIGLSFAMWLLVEAPLINMCNHLLFTKSKSIQPKEPEKNSQKSEEPERNGINHHNGHAKTKIL